MILKEIRLWTVFGTGSDQAEKLNYGKGLPKSQ